LFNHHLEAIQLLTMTKGNRKFDNKIPQRVDMEKCAGEGEK